MRRIRPAGSGLELRVRATVASVWPGDMVFNDRSLPGTPDVSLPGPRLAIFADGCFWHRCRRCLVDGRIRVPGTAWWWEKLEGNARRDARVRRKLRRLGWGTMTIREHDMGKDVASRLRRRLGKLKF